jgi:hypothetical protein
MSHLTVKIIARGMMVATIAWAGTAVAEPYVTHTDLELRVGEEYLCGTCHPHRFRTNVQVFVDRLFPIRRVGDGVLEIGPYAKGALLDGVEVPQIAGGAVVGYRLDRYEVLVNVGLAYATDKIGSPNSPGSSDSSQTNLTYDLGLSLRYHITQYYFSVGYQHNSNGEDLGLNVLGSKDHNPGIDGVFVGVGIRF